MFYYILIVKLPHTTVYCHHKLYLQKYTLDSNVRLFKIVFLKTTIIHEKILKWFKGIKTYTFE